MDLESVGGSDRHGATSALLEIDAERFRENFDRRPFLIGHRLAAHPLFSLPRLVELARELPADCVEYNAGNLGVNQDPALTPKTGLSVEETIRRIEECGSWMVLKYVERVPAYRDLLEACLAEFRVHTEPISPGMDRHEGFIFIGSPGAVTPFHMDPEFNFLLHVHGPKTMRVFPREDRSLLAEEQIEEFYTAGKPRNLPYQEEFASKAVAFELAPGMGVHVPVNAPHWVQVGASYAVSFSVTFRTHQSDRRAALHTANAALRRRGWRPRNLGQSPLRDGIKYFLFRVWRRAACVLGSGPGRA
jgi:hypothetical protein